jgi:hypothetical protein
VKCPRTGVACEHPACYQAEFCVDRDGTKGLAKFASHVPGVCPCESCRETMAVWNDDPEKWPPVPPATLKYNPRLTNEQYAQAQELLAAERIAGVTLEVARDLEGARRLLRAAQRCHRCLKFTCVHMGFDPDPR